MRRIVLFTGSGTSAESGIPTFRSNEDGELALWNGVDPNQVCNIRTYEKNKELCRNFYNQFRSMLKDISPSSFHRTVKTWQDQLKEQDVKLIVVTQNVDDLFEKAGIENIQHIHGDIRYMQCLQCRNRWFIGYREQTESTRCPSCRSPKCKPAVVFFNEDAPEYEKTIHLLEGLGQMDALVVIGTSCSVFPIQYFLEKRDIYKIYSGLEKPYCLRYIDIDQIILGKCTTTIHTIQFFIQNWLDESNTFSLQ